jgi:hypothetical protein
MENKTNTKTFGILSMAEMLTVKAGTVTVVEVIEPKMVKDSSIT